MTWWFTKATYLRKKRHLKADWLKGRGGRDLHVILIELHHSWQQHSPLIGILVAGRRGPWQVISQWCDGNPLRLSQRDGVDRLAETLISGEPYPWLRFRCISHLPPLDPIVCLVDARANDYSGAGGLCLNNIIESLFSLLLWHCMTQIFSAGKFDTCKKQARKFFRVSTQRSLAAELGSLLPGVCVASCCPE